MSEAQHTIRFTYLSQEDLLEAGCLDFRLAIQAAESALLAHRNGDVLFPDKIVQIFNQETQERINCLPSALLLEKVCGMKWVSVFPPNVPRFGLQNLTALFILSEIEKGLGAARSWIIDYHRTYDLVCRHASEGLGRAAGCPLPDGLEVVPGWQAPGPSAADTLGHDPGSARRRATGWWRCGAVRSGVLP
jgi:hypothetical protein